MSTSLKKVSLIIATAWLIGGFSFVSAEESPSGSGTFFSSDGNLEPSNPYENDYQSGVPSTLQSAPLSNPSQVGQLNFCPGAGTTRADITTEQACNAYCTHENNFERMEGFGLNKSKYADVDCCCWKGSVTSQPKKVTCSELPDGTCELGNTLKGDVAKTPQEFAGRIIKNFLGIVGVLALVMFMWGGAQIMMSRFGGDDKTKYQQGIQTLVGAGAGLVVIFGSYALVEFLFSRLLS